MQHRVIDGRIYRIVTVEAADTRALSQHTMAQRPIGATQAREIREAVSR